MDILKKNLKLADLLRSHCKSNLLWIIGKGSLMESISRLIIMKGLIKGCRLMNRIRYKIFSLSQLNRLIRNGRCRKKCKMIIRFRNCKKCNRIIIRNKEFINRFKIINMIPLKVTDKNSL